MSTSGITDWPLTVGDIVKQAMYELGELSQGDDPDGEEMEDGILRLNAMLRSWSGEGNMFREASATVALSAGTASAALAADVRDVSSVRYVGSYNRPLAAWNRGQFRSLPNPAQTGTPVAYYVSETISGRTINVWPVPSVDCVLDLDYSRVAQTVTDPSETVDVPEEWQEALILGLASRLAPMLGTTETAPAKVARIDSRGQAIYQRLLDRDRPDVYVFEPDY